MRHDPTIWRNADEPYDAFEPGRVLPSIHEVPSLRCRYIVTLTDVGFPESSSLGCDEIIAICKNLCVGKFNMMATVTDATRIVNFVGFEQKLDAVKFFLISI